MRLVLISLLAALLACSQSSPGTAEKSEAEKVPDLQALLSSYLQSRLESAQLAMTRLQEKQATGNATVSDVLVAEEEVDRCQLHLLLASDAKLIADHPILSELRRELGVPELTKTLPAAARNVASAAIHQYLQKSLVRAERVLESATLLQKMGRVTEAEVLAAKGKVEGIKLLLVAETLNLRKASK